MRIWHQSIASLEALAALMEAETSRA